MQILTYHIPRLTLAASLCIIFAQCIGCQLPSLTPKAVEINKTNPDFLKNAGVDVNTNPHKNEKCNVCHLASKELLTKGNPSGDEKIKRMMMRSDLINLCTECHAASAEMEHRVGIPTQLNRKNLPLDPHGNMTCATTCHDMHAEDPGLAKYMLRHPFDDLCMSCHDV